MTKLLKKARFFKHLEGPELKRILSISKLAKFPAGALIFGKKSVGNHFFVVNSGRVKIFTSASAKRSKTLAYLGPGEFLGEMALLGGKVRSASAMAEENCELLVIDKTNFQRLLLTNRAFTLRLLYTLSARLQKTNEELEELLFHNMLGRLAHALHSLSRDGGKTSDEIKMTMRQLADYVGTTREPLSRALSVLVKSKVLTHEGGTIRIIDAGRLASIAQLKP